MSRFVPIIPIVKMAQIWILLENVALTEKKSVFSIETLCKYTLDSVVYVEWSKNFLMPSICF